MVNWEKTMTGKAESRTPVPTSNETVLTDSSLTLKMSMINKLKESQKNPAFLDDDDIDNMDFPLPSTSKSASAPSLDELKNLTGSGGGSGGSSSSSRSGGVAVAATPQGPKRLDASEYKDWVCVYPCYLNSEKTVREGRKIRKDKAHKNPTAYHIAVAVQSLGLSVVYETKRHPRDWATLGRVKVQLKNGNFFVNPKITTRDELYYAIAERLPHAEKTSSPPDNIITPMSSLAEVEAVVDRQRKAQGLPTLAEMRAQSAKASPSVSTKPKKQKIRVHH